MYCFDRTKEESMVISIDVDKAFERTQCTLCNNSFTSLHKIWVREPSLLPMHIYLLSTCLSSCALFLSYSQGGWFRNSLGIFPQTRNKAAQPLCTATIQHCVGGIKRMSADKPDKLDKKKLPPYAEDMIDYLECQWLKKKKRSNNKRDHRGDRMYSEQNPHPHKCNQSQSAIVPEPNLQTQSEMQKST